MTATHQAPQMMAATINAMLRLNAPEPGTKTNGWFGGYGCRWDAASRSWFTVLPFGADAVVEKLAALFKAGGACKVTVPNEGGVREADGGRGLQVSAYV